MAKQRKKRSTVSFKDIQIAYLMDGVNSIARLHKEGKASGITIRRALTNLKESGREVAGLEKWIRENLGTGIRGRTAPTPGQERIYRAQQIKTSGPFLRLPLAALQIDKGEVVSVVFQKDQIVVKKV
ncbi:MAG: hypothetical protein V4534_03750 [Myxococcota bacterium]